MGMLLILISMIKKKTKNKILYNYIILYYIRKTITF